MKYKISKNILWLFLLLISILIMGIGYSSISSITGEITGRLGAEPQNDVFITNVEYASDNHANINTSEIKNYKGTMMGSTVELSDTDPSSSITYKVTVYNNSENTYPFLGVIYGDETEFYDNPNIIYEISGFNYGELIKPKETKDIYITFKYKDGVIPEKTILNSYLNFKIADPNRLRLAYSTNSSANYLGSTVKKDKIETIKFEMSKLPIQGSISKFDASEKQDKSIIGYYTDEDNNGLYELTFVSEEIIAANKNAQYLFQRLTNLKEIDFKYFSTYDVTSMNAMFSGCSGLTTLDVSSLNTSQVEDMRAMFSECNGLNTLDLSSFDTSKVTSMNSMFEGCSVLTTLNVSNFDTSKVANMSNMFRRCTVLTTLDVSRFNTSQVTNMNYMFYGCDSLPILDVTSFDTNQVTDMNNMFSYCKTLTTIDVKGFRTSQVNNMSNMFLGCNKLTKIDVSGFNTSEVTYMNNMFNGCRELKILNLSSFNTSKVTNMDGMFNNCNKLITVYVSEYNTELNTGWTTTAVTNSSNMFIYNNSIIGGNGTTYDSNHTDASYARIDTAETPGYFTDATKRSIYNKCRICK